MADPLDRLQAALADRYIIERELGRGGMATVYLARDQKLGREVALKVLRPELAASLGAERFLREIEIAAKLTHSNILALHDCGGGDECLYYTMPFVEGESLRDRLNREKQLSIEDALQITREVADALGHAHSLGIVHRDIKPENILFQGGHALVADFGIARAVREAGAETLTETGLAIGTPAYMSPEQASGSKDIDARSDLYSLGCVLYEMLSGETPYLGNTPQAIVAKKLSEPAPRVSVVRDKVPPAVEAALDRALSRTPADRFATAAQFAEALAGVPAAFGGGRPVWHWVARLAAVVVIVTVGVVLLRGWRSGTSTAAAEEIDRLVVVPFENRTGDPAAAEWGFTAAEYITRALDRASVVTVVPASRVRDLVREVDPAVGMPLEEIARRSRARYALAGSYALSGDRIRFDVELVNAESGELLGAFDPVAGPVDSLEAVITLLSERVTAATMARLSPDLSPGAARLWSSPPSLELVRGLVTIQDLFCRVRGEEVIDQAQPWLEQAPDFAPLLLMTALSYMGLNRFREADSVLTLIEPLREQLTSQERTAVEWTHGLLYGDHLEATRAAEQLYRANPGGGGYHAGLVALNTNRFADALERLLSVDLDTPCYRVLSPWWWVTARTYHMLGRYEEELQVARDGFERFGRNEFLYFEAIAQAGLGRLDAVDSLLDLIADLPPQPPYFSPGRYTALIALDLKALGQREAYEALMDRAVAWFAATPARELRGHRGQAFYYAERWSDADTLFAALSAETPDNLDYRGFRGVALVHLGRREEALETDRWLEQLDYPYMRWMPTRWRAAIAAALGDRAGAVGLLEQAYQEGMELGYIHHRDPEWETLRDYRPYQEFVRPKG